MNHKGRINPNNPKSDIMHHRKEEVLENEGRDECPVYEAILFLILEPKKRKLKSKFYVLLQIFLSFLAENKKN